MSYRILVPGHERRGRCDPQQTPTPTREVKCVSYRGTSQLRHKETGGGWYRISSIVHLSGGSKSTQRRVVHVGPTVTSKGCWSGSVGGFHCLCGDVHCGTGRGPPLSVRRKEICNVSEPIKKYRGVCLTLLATKENTKRTVRL